MNEADKQAWLQEKKIWNEVICKETEAFYSILENIFLFLFWALAAIGFIYSVFFAPLYAIIILLIIICIGLFQ